MDEAPLPDESATTLRAALRLVYIVDAEGAREWQRLDAVLAGGVGALWLRVPEATGADLDRLARALAARCRDHGAALIVGDRADVALAVGAAGVQLGHRSPSPRRIRPWFRGWMGVSCHDREELARAEAAGADYAVLSPVFGVPRKGAPLGLGGFGRLVAGTALPVVGLGGIETGNAAAVRDAGAVGVAVIRALRDAPSPEAAARDLSGP